MAREGAAVVIGDVLLKFRLRMEIGGDRLFSRPGDDYDLLDSGLGGFLHHVLEHGLFQDGQKLFGDRFGHRQESCAQSGGGYDGFSYLHNTPPGKKYSSTWLPRRTRNRRRSAVS